MPDLIDRQALLDSIAAVFSGREEDAKAQARGAQKIIDFILAAPTVEIECGTWIEHVDETHFCSNCGDDALWDMESKQEYLSSYCPTCGKRMTKVKSYGEDVADNG